LGIGINSASRTVEGEFCPGWRDTLGELPRDYIFDCVDSMVSSIIEKDDRIPDNSPMSLQIDSWKALSRLLSRGQRVEYKGKEVRVVGIDSDGFLHIVDRGNRKALSTTDDLVWGFGNNVVTD
jgi:biotin-(acetyl-CoA carboxylase) ligase